MCDGKFVMHLSVWVTCPLINLTRFFQVTGYKVNVIHVNVTWSMIASINILVLNEIKILFVLLNKCICYSQQLGLITAILKEFI